jgi:type II restriction/modification system DNA methylase subunit YeeA
MPYVLNKKQKIVASSPISRRMKIPENAKYFETIASSYEDPGEDWCETVFFDDDLKEIARKRINGY